MVQPERQAALSRQISVINPQLLFPRQESYELSTINTQWNRMRLRSTTPSLASVSSTSSCSSCDTDISDASRRTGQKRVTFCPNPSLTIHEHSDNEEDSVFITNTAVADELKTEELVLDTELNS